MAFILSDYRKDLNNKGELAEDLAIMAESLINYYGEEYESLICDAIRSCKIRILKNENGTRQKVADILREEKMLINFDPDEMQKLDRGFFSSPKIVYENGAYSIRSKTVKKIIVLPSHFNPCNPDSIGILAKECIKLIQSEINPYTIEGDILTTRSGFTITKEKLATSERGVTRTLIETKGQGLSDGCIAYDLLCLMRKEYYDDFDIHGIDHERLIGGFLIDGDNLQLREFIKKAEIIHDDSELIEAIDQRSNISFNNWIRMTDELHALEKKRREAPMISDEEAAIARNKVDRCFADIATQVRLSGKDLLELQGRTI